MEGLVLTSPAGAHGLLVRPETQMSNVYCYLRFSRLAYTALEQVTFIGFISN